MHHMVIWYWYKHNPQEVAETESVKVLEDFPNHRDRTLQASKSNITRKGRTKESCKIIDFTFPVTKIVSAKELEKLSADKNIYTEAERMSN